MRDRSHWPAESPSPAAAPAAALLAFLGSLQPAQNMLRRQARAPATAPTFDRVQHSSDRNIVAIFARNIWRRRSGAAVLERTIATPRSGSSGPARPGDRVRPGAAAGLRRAGADALQGIASAWGVVVGVVALDEQEPGLTAPLLGCSTAQGRHDPGGLRRTTAASGRPLLKEALARRHRSSSSGATQLGQMADLPCGSGSVAARLATAGLPAE